MSNESFQLALTKLVGDESYRRSIEHSPRQLLSDFDLDSCSCQGFSCTCQFPATCQVPGTCDVPASCQVARTCTIERNCAGGMASAKRPTEFNEKPRPRKASAKLASNFEALEK